MSNNYLLVEDNGVPGIYRCKLFTGSDTSDIRVYIPGISTVNPFNADGLIDVETIDSKLDSFPKVQWCCYNIESKELENQDAFNWCMFENGDFKRPVVISYVVIGRPGGAIDGDNVSPLYDEKSASDDSMSAPKIDENAANVAKKAIELAVKIANDDTHHYQYGAKGPVNFDCSGFVWYCYSNVSGGGLSNLSYAATVSMESIYIQAGFTNVTSSVQLTSGTGLITGDILLYPGHHVDMYVGGNQRVGAHSTQTGIYVDTYGYDQPGYNNKYSVVLRYTGK